MTNTVEAPIPSTSEERATKRIKFAGLPPYEARDNIDAGKQPAVCPVSGEPIWSDSFDVSKATSSTDSIKRELAAVKQLYAIYKVSDLGSAHLHMHILPCTLCAMKRHLHDMPADPVPCPHGGPCITAQSIESVR